MAISDFRMSIPVTAAITVAMSLTSGLVGMHTTESIVTSRVDQIEKTVIAQQIVLESMTSRNEFRLFRDENDRMMTDILSRLKDIDNKVTR